MFTIGYWILDLAIEDKSKRLWQLGVDPSYENKANLLMFTTFSPTFDRVAFVREHNIYVQSLETKDILQLTKDGSDMIINGKVLRWNKWINGPILYSSKQF